MTRGKFKSTTAILLAASLALPQPALAQSGNLSAGDRLAQQGQGNQNRQEKNEDKRNNGLSVEEVQERLEEQAGSAAEALGLGNGKEGGQWSGNGQGRNENPQNGRANFGRQGDDTAERRQKQAGERRETQGRNTEAGRQNRSSQGNRQQATGTDDDGGLQSVIKEQANELRDALGGDGNAGNGRSVGADQKQQARQKAERDDPGRLSAQEQARRAAQAAAEALGAAALTGQGEVIDRSRTTVSDSEARSSAEAFGTDVRGRQRQNRAAAQGDDDDGLLKALGAIAVAGIGTYAVGQMLDGGGQVVANTGDRVVVENDGHYRVIKDESALLRRPGNEVARETFADGSVRTTVTARDGSQTITVRAPDGRVLRRVLRYPDGRQVVLIDDTRTPAEVDVSALSRSRAGSYDYNNAGSDELRAALRAAQTSAPNRAFSLYQIRQIDVVRYQVPVISLDAINFETDSAVIQPREAEELAALGNAMRDAIDRDPRQVFLIEGHTDTVGSAAYNLALSDRRAESVALALTEYFDVPPANMVVQGYGETDLKVERYGDIRANRRAAVRNITPLLNGGG